MTTKSSWDRLDTFTSIVSSSYIPGEAGRLPQTMRAASQSCMLEGQMQCSRLQFSASSAAFEKLSFHSDTCLYIYMLTCDSYNHSLTGEVSPLNTNLLQLQSLATLGDDIGFMAQLSLSHLYAAMMLPSAAMKYFETARQLLNVSGYELPKQLKMYAMHIYGKILSCDLANSKYGLQFYSIAGMLYPESLYPFFTATLNISRAVLLSAAGDTEEARNAIHKACDLLKPDGFILPFGEFFTLFDQNLISVLEEYWPESAAKLQIFWSQNIPCWIDVRNRLTGETLTSRLTKREHDVAIRAAAGMSNKEIAAQLGISENTVKSFLRSIFNKLNIDHRSKLPAYIYKPSDF